MSLDLLLLGLLREPASGYDLGRYFEESLRHLWSTDLPQLYRTLNRLAREGLLSVRTEPSSRGPVRRVYQVTDAGLERLRLALPEGPAISRSRDPLLARVHLLGALGDDRAALDLLYQVRAELESELEALRGRPAAQVHVVPDPGPVEPEAFYAELARDGATARETALLAWITRSIRRLEDLLFAKRSDPPG